MCRPIRRLMLRMIRAVRPMNKLLALVDMDRTLVDYDRQLWKDLRGLAAPGEPDPSEIHPQPFWIRNRIEMIRRTQDWWLNLPELDLGFDILGLLNQTKCDIQILTQGPQEIADSWRQKKLWCSEHIHKDIEITVTRRKHQVFGHILVDDYSKYISDWLDFKLSLGGQAGLVIQPIAHNTTPYIDQHVVCYDGTPDSFAEVHSRILDLQDSLKRAA